MKTRLYIVIILLFRISYPGHGQTISRVIKEIDSFSGPFLEMDSLLYFYGGDRGDTFISYNNFSFHFDSAFRSTSGGAGAIIGNSYYLCTYNANNSTLSYLSYTGSAYDSIRNFYSYDANNNLTSATYQSVPNLPVRLVNSGSDTMEYDSYNNNIYTLSRIWDTLSRSWTNSGQNFITYDVNNNVLIDSGQVWYSGVWVDNQVISNTYSGSLVASTLERYWNGIAMTNSRFTVYTYNSSSKQVRRNIQQWDVATNSWKNAFLDSFAYTSANDLLYDFSSNWDDSTNSYIPTFKDSLAFDSHHNELCSIKQSLGNDTFGYASVFIGTYNSYNQPLSKLSYLAFHSDSISFLMDYQYYRYFYELHLVNGIAKTPVDVFEVKLYPSPASNSIKVETRMLSTEQVIIGIYDSKGRLCRQFGETIDNNFSKTIPLSGLPDGTYFLSIKSKDILTTKPFTILRGTN